MMTSIDLDRPQEHFETLQLMAYSGSDDFLQIATNRCVVPDFFNKSSTASESSDVRVTSSDPSFDYEREILLLLKMYSQTKSTRRGVVRSKIIFEESATIVLNPPKRYEKAKKKTIGLQS